MKSIISKSMAIVAVCAALLSFSTSFGGEGFEISLNGKLVLQRFGSEINTVTTLALGKITAGDELSIRYHHCGKVGRNRVVTIKDEQNNIVKEWRFADAAVPVAAMTCSVSDVVSLRKLSSGTFKLYYTSSELPNGRLLANISMNNNSMARQ